MNLRQRHKKLKQELERLKKKCDPFRSNGVIYDRGKIVQLKVKKEYDPCLFGYVPDEVITREIGYLMGDAVKPYIKRFISADPETGHLVVEADLDVVVKED